MAELIDVKGERRAVPALVFAFASGHLRCFSIEGNTRALRFILDSGRAEGWVILNGNRSGRF